MRFKINDNAPKSSPSKGSAYGYQGVFDFLNTRPQGIHIGSRQEKKRGDMMDETSENMLGEVLVFNLDGHLFNIILDHDEIKRELTEYMKNNYRVERSFNPLYATINELRLGHHQGREIYERILDILYRHEIRALAIPNDEALKNIKGMKSGYNKVVIISKRTRRYVQELLAEHGLEDYVDDFLTLEDTTNGSPHSDNLYTVWKRYRPGSRDLAYVVGSEMISY